MKKAEIKAATNSKLIIELANTYANLISSYNLNKGTSQLEKHFNDLKVEMLKRELVTEQDFKQIEY